MHSLYLCKLFRGRFLSRKICSGNVEDLVKYMEANKNKAFIIFDFDGKNALYNEMYVTLLLQLLNYGTVKN